MYFNIKYVFYSVSLQSNIGQTLFEKHMRDP